MIYRILPNTRAGAKTKMFQRGACIQGLIRSKSNDVSFLIAGKSSVYAYSADWNEMGTCDFVFVTVKSCEIVLISVHIWIISWDATKRSLIQCLTDRSTALTGRS